jgi:hypothetical protein
MTKPSPGHKPEPDPLAGVVDRLLAQLPGLQGEPYASRSAPRVPAQSTQSTTTSMPFRVQYVSQSVTLSETIALWGRVLLGLSLGIMMAGWPYLRTCGFPLFGYLSAVLTVILAGMWAAVTAWRYRSSLAHVISLVLVFYGVMLVTAELLPRTGYAVDHATWQCEDSASGFTSVTT